MEVDVDRNQCEANGVCVGIAPDIFDLNDEDELMITAGPVPQDREPLVHDAIAMCPKAALFLKQ